MILDASGQIIKSTTQRVSVKRTYDAAATNRHTSKHFINADNRDADSLISVSLETLRNRVRYEIRNNCYAKGIVETKKNDIVGTGPRLQFKSKSDTFNREIEKRWAEYCEVCDYSGKLKMSEILGLVGSLQQDESGESITVLQYEAGVSGEPALRLAVVEPDRLSTPYSLAGVQGINDQINQGISFDSAGRPTKYYIQKKHPGAKYIASGLTIGDYNVIPADQVIHLYRQDRPGQSRGVPWLTPALPLFAQLRRYTLAVCDAAELAAVFAGIMKTSGQLTEDADDIEALEAIEVERNALLTLPKGWDITQFKAEQPAQSYAEFKAEILNEIGRCLNMPYNVVAANSAKYNYASGRLDWQIYFRFISTVQNWIAGKFLNRVLWAWLSEAILIPGYLPAADLADLSIDSNTVGWYWPGTEHVDPKKEADAQAIRLKNMTTTYAAEYARQGKDWERQFEQIATEKKKMTELGIKPTEVKPGNKNDDEEKKTDDDEDQENETEKKSDGRRYIAIG